MDRAHTSVSRSLPVPGPTQPVLPAAGVRRILVFRALMLGDLLCAVPALRALKAAYPEAKLTLVSLPWARSLAERLPQVDDFIAFPGHPALPELPADMAAWPDFLEQVQACRADLAVQLHGSGGIANTLVACFGARRMAGFWQPGAWCPDEQLFTPWPEGGHEIERLLAVVERLGLPRRGEQLEFPLRDEDRAGLRRVWPEAPQGAYVCVHPGAQLRSRRWPVLRFAAVADALAAQGLHIVITGTASEAPLAAQLQAAMQAPATNLVGRTSLWELGALIEGARLVLSNDTGISHVAVALGSPSVVVSSGGEVQRWQRMDAQLHRVLWGDVACRPCSHELCPSAHECALAITPEAVIAAARHTLSSGANAHVPQ
ncbi:glycosyltransferase family 9 protein [Aquabacterium sp. A7-Y]|uniref:glycosyltransferase family 9 protein n=1 Tax=Aquabacterium sp. A7-Y TaxID=1349605 RepID=UPI00223E7F76|nr:glycosyltransferase family 9 protein [Aquabacterium sp. A7-Y]MCW7536317.1 glycosyltransferase family 9 protein [Aquabacterium sp. A7-Y]